MIKYELSEILLIGSEFTAHSPYNEEYEKTTNLSYSCDVDINKDHDEHFAFCMISLNLDVINEKEESDLLDVNIGYLVIINIIESDLIEQDLENILKEKATEIIAPYLNHDIRDYFTRSGYPALHVYNFEMTDDPEQSDGTGEVDPNSD